MEGSYALIWRTTHHKRLWKSTENLQLGYLGPWQEAETCKIHNNKYAKEVLCNSKTLWSSISGHPELLLESEARYEWWTISQSVLVLNPS